MRGRIVAVGTGMPDWVVQAQSEYEKRLSHWLPIDLAEIAPGQRGKGRSAERATADEGERVLTALPKSCWCVALDGRGKAYSSEQLAGRLEFWRGCGRDLAFVIGGPEGHAPGVLERADERWSLGPLTLPHPLVRVVLVEQLYRAASMLANHPYHRG